MTNELQLNWECTQSRRGTHKSCSFGKASWLRKNADRGNLTSLYWNRCKACGWNCKKMDLATSVKAPKVHAKNIWNGHLIGKKEKTESDFCGVLDCFWYLVIKVRVNSGASLTCHASNVPADPFFCNAQKSLLFSTVLHGVGTTAPTRSAIDANRAL